MGSEAFERHIPLEGAYNFRDLGGYRTNDGRTVKWRSLFRSGELHLLTDLDVSRLRGELGLTTVLDLRTTDESDAGGMGQLQNLGVQHHSLPFTASLAEDFNLLQAVQNMGEFYIELTSRKAFGINLLEALSLIADPHNHALAFHCSVGKDRTGVLAAIRSERWECLTRRLLPIMSCRRRQWTR